MKSKLPLLSNVFVFIVGLLLVVLHNRAAILEMIIIIIGIMFIVPSCLALIALFARKEKRMMSGVAGVPIVGGLILGIALVAAPQFFVGFTAYTFAIVLILGAVYKLWALLSWSRRVHFPIGCYIIPTLTLAAGIVILSTDVLRIESVLVLVTGISFMAYAINSLLEYLVYRHFLKQQAAAEAGTAQSVEIVEITNDDDLK